MSSENAERLYQLLPAIYRIRDIEQGYPLRGLIEVLAHQSTVVEADIARLYENWFIETCEEWVVPFLGALLGVRGLLAPERAGFSQRALVANTLRYRRRKGTVPVLEQIVHDVTGWAARAVELFKAVAVTQNLEHLRPGLGGTADLKSLHDPELVGSAFDPLTYTPDVRLMSGTRQAPQLEGERPVGCPGRRLAGVSIARPNLPNICLFVWRLQSYRIERATAFSQGDGQRFNFHPLGCDMPLFNYPDDRTNFDNVTREFELPVRLRTEALAEELEARKTAAKNGSAPGFFSPRQVFEIFGPAHDDIKMRAYQIWSERTRKGLAGDALTDWVSAENQVLKDKSPRLLRPDEIRVATISETDWADPGGYSGDQVWVDTEQGRIILPLSWIGEIDYRQIDHSKNQVVYHYNDPNIRVSYSYAFSDSIGGGPYDRRRGISNALDAVENPESFGNVIDVNKEGSLEKALEVWAANSWTSAVIQFGSEQSRDNSSHFIQNLNLEIGLNNSQLLIQAINWCRPVLLGNLEICGGGPASELTLSGLLIVGQIQISGTLGKLALTDCTLAPGFVVQSKEPPSHWPVRVQPSPGFASITASGAGDSLQVRIERCIVGPLRLPATIAGLTVTDSIIDAPEAASAPEVSDQRLPASGLIYSGLARSPVVVRPTAEENQLPAIGDKEGKAGPAAVLQRVTIFGSVHVSQMQAEDVLFTSPVTVERTSTGLLRNCFVPSSFRIPRAETCQPENGSELFPSFTARQYGEPGYAQLSLACPVEIRTGGTGGAEIGVFHNLRQPQREAALLAQLEEYLRFGLEAGVIYVD